MSRNPGTGVYSVPVGTDAITNTTIASSPYNAFIHDVETDLNTPRPIVAGGTGGTDVNSALINLSGERAAQVVTNWDSMIWMPGSFYAATSATGTAPVAAHAFSGICYSSDPLPTGPSYTPVQQNIVLEARDLTDTGNPVYIRVMTAGVWGAWKRDIGTAANVVINGDFRINQGGYVSAAVLAAGLYGHDQWKAGAAGGDYSFAQLKSSTQITIAAGKSLIQPIEDFNVVGGSYVLSWTGTAQARAGVNTLTPSGAYAASPLLISGQTAGTVMSIEFNAGTLGTVKLESGARVTPFVMRLYDQELVTCQRYFRWVGYGMQGQAEGVSTLMFSYMNGWPLRSAPTVTPNQATINVRRYSNATDLPLVVTSNVDMTATPIGGRYVWTFSGAVTVGERFHCQTDNVLKLDARL